MRRGLLAPLLTAALVGSALPTLAATANAAPGATARTTAMAAGLTASDPAISADGRWVVFVGRADGQERVHRHDTVTGETRVVAPALAPGEVADPSVSDDGRTVVFTHRRPGEHSQVIWADMRHDSFRRASGTSEWEPANGDSWGGQISGDGSLVTFTTEATDIINKPAWEAGSAPGSDVVVAAPVDESFLVTLVSPEEPGVDFAAAGIDAIGAHVAFTSERGQVHVADLADTRAIRLEKVGPGTEPALSADGASLALLRPQPVYAGGPERSATWLRTLATGAELQVDVEGGGWPLAGDTSAPRLSADGSRVLLTHRTGDGHELVLRDARVGTTVTVAERIDATAGSDLSDDGHWAVHVTSGALQLTDVAALAGATAGEAPKALWPALVMRSATRARGGGYVLHAVPAHWEPVRAGRVERQWLRDGRPIRGAKGLTYEITRADVGRDLALRERLHVRGVPTGLSVGRAYRVRPDRAVLTVPGRVVRPRPGAVKLRVRVTTRAGSETYVDGSAVPQGRVRVKVGRTTVTRKVGAKGTITVRLPKQRPGRTVVRVRHLGTPYLASAPMKKVRLVVRRSR